MKHKIFFALTYYIFLSLLTGCDSVETKKHDLIAAEQCMTTRPDSALTILKGIDADKLLTADDKARYAVLYTQAKDKNYIDDTDLTLISEAKAYYDESDNLKYKFLATYYYGRILCNNKNYPLAMVAYAQAEELLPELNDSYQAGLLYSEIGDIYHIHYDYNKSLSAYQKAFDFYEQSGLESHTAYALLNIGIAYWHLEIYESAIDYIDRALKQAVKLEDKYLEQHCCQSLCAIYDKTNQVEKCGNMVEILMSRFDFNRFSPICLGVMADYFAKIKDFNQADRCISQAWKQAADATDSINLFSKSAYIMKNSGKAEEGFNCFIDGLRIQNKLLHYALQQPIVSAQKDYFKHQADFNSYKLKKNAQIHLTLAVIAFLFVIIAVILIRNRILSKNLKISEYMNLAAELQNSLRDKDNELSEIYIRRENDSLRLNEMSRQIADLFHRQYELLDKLSSTYYETHGLDKEKECIYKQVESEINKFANNDKSISQLEAIVNNYKRNVINLIRSEIPNISERDIKLLCFIYAGFSAKTISIFIGETPGNIQTRKYRLRSKISKLQPQNMNIMLEEMP